MTETPAGTPPPEDEFAGIPSPRRRPSWLSLVVAVFAAYLIFHQRADVMYALSSSSPQSIEATPEGAPVFAAGGPSDLPVNRYVRVTGTPDFESGLSLDAKGAWKFRQMLRMLGTNGRLFVQRVNDPLPVELAERTSYAGRLVRLDALPFAASIRRYFSQHVTTTHFFDPRRVHERLAGGAVPLVVVDRAGQAVELAGNRIVILTIIKPDALTVEVPADRYPTADSARKAILATGARTSGDGIRITVAPPEAWRFSVTLPEGPTTKTISALADLAPEAHLLPVVDDVQVRAKDLTPGEGGLAFISADGARRGTALFDSLRGVRTTEQVAIPEDAYLVLEGEEPRHHYKAVVSSVFLLGFAVLSLLALWKKA